MLLVGCGRWNFDSRDAGAGTATDACVAGSGPTVERVQSGDLVIAAPSSAGSFGLLEPAPSDRTILFFSLREVEPSPKYGAVACALVANNVSCARPLAGTDTGSGEIRIHWTAVTFASGVSVQRGVQTGLTPFTIAPVDLASSFVVLGGCAMNTGNTWGTDEYARAKLTDAQTLDLHKFADEPTNIAWQVVSMTGASVQRGATTLDATQTGTTAEIGPAGSTGFLLLSYSADTISQFSAAATSLSGSVESDVVTFNRGGTQLPLDISWEVIALPFATARGTAMLPSGTTQVTEPVAGLVGASAVALASSQALFGQSGGLTNYNLMPEPDLVGEAAVTLTPVDGGVVLERATAVGDTKVSWAAIDFSRPACR